MTSETRADGPTSPLRAAVQTVAVAGQGLLHAAAAGAFLLVSLRLAAPGVLESVSPGRAWADAVALGLACLRVPLGSGGLSGTFAPLGGALLTSWGIAAAVRRWGPRWPGSRARAVTSVAGAFGVGCLAAAALARPGAQVDPSLLGAAVAGAGWGAMGAAWGTSHAGPPGPARRRAASGAALVAAARAGSARALAAHPRLGPGVVTIVVAAFLGGLAGAALLLLGVAGASASAAAGGLLLGLAAAPNLVAAAVALGLGAPVEVVSGGTDVIEATRATFALWDWAGRGWAPPHVLALALVPLGAVLAGGRAAARAAPGDPPFVRGLGIGILLAASLVAVGWAGSLRASAETAAGAATLRLGVPPLQLVALSLAWGVAGAYLGPLLQRPRSRLAAASAGAPKQRRGGQG